MRSHAGAFTQVGGYTKTRLHTGVFTEETVCPEALSHRRGFKDISLYTQMRSHTAALTQKRVYAQTPE